MKRVLGVAAGLSVSLALAPEALAGDDPRWAPGHRTTASVEGEVVPDERSSTGDGVYGRFDGDLSLGLGLGLSLGGGTRGALVSRALYYNSVGLFAGYADALGAEAAIPRALSFGLELRPLFLIRWSKGLELGEPLFDLTLDSLALELGALAAEPEGGTLGDDWGFRAALGFGVPLSGRADGPWIEARGAVRSGFSDNPFELLVLVSLYGSIVTPIVK